MANEQNKSNKGPQNTLADSAMSDIESIGRRASRHTAEDIAQRVRLAEARRNISIYEEGLQSGPPDAVAQMLGRQLAAERKTVNSLEPRIELRAETQRQRFAAQTQSLIERNFAQSSINGQAAEFGRSVNGQRLSMGMMNTPYEELEARRNAAMAQINTIGQRASSLAEGLYNERGQQDPAKLQQLQQLYSQRNRLVNVIGSIDAAQRSQRGLGLDPQSRQDALLGAGAAAKKLLFREGIAEQMRSGQGDLGGKSSQELKQKEIQLSMQLVDALEKLKDTAGKSSEEIEKLKESAEKTAEELEQVKEARGMAGGGGAGGNAGAYLTSAAGAFGAIGAGIQQIGVNQRLAQTANVSGFAGIENQKYQTYRSASMGSVADQLALSQFDEAELFGRSVRAAANVAVGAQAAGGVTQAAAGGVRVASTFNPVENAVGTSAAMGQRLQGAGEIIQGGVVAATAGTDLERDVSGSQASIAGVNSQMDARRALQAITAEQMQGFRDFGVGMSVAAQGMGNRGGAFVDRMINKSMMQQMVDARLSPEQMAQLSTQGVASMGSMFNESQIFGARGLERSGFGTIGENMQRMTTLASAGSNNPQAGLSSVLEAAFTKSLDSSKALTSMVENTAALASSGVGRMMGIDTTAASAQILAANVNANDPNQEYAVQRAMTAAQLMQGIGTDTGVNFAAMSATARISKMAGVSGDEAILLQQMTDQDLLAMQKMEPNELEDKLYDRGIAARGRGKDVLEQAMKARTITKLQMGGAGLAQGVDASALADKISRGEKLTDQEQLAFNRASSFAGFAGGQEGLRSATSLLNSEPNQGAKTAAADAMAGKGGTEQQKMLDDMRTQGFKQLSQAAMEATANFKTAADALKALGQLAKSVENVGDTGGEGRFKTAAADSAKSFGESTMKFKGSVDEFSSAVDRMVRGSGLPSYNDPSYIDRVNNLSEKAKAPGGK